MLMAPLHRETTVPDYEGTGTALDISNYLAILKRRFLYLVIPLLAISMVGAAVVFMLPAVYLAEGKILVESQQIPTDLVRPTINATAKERIQVIEQRIMTRDNLLGIIDKFQMFGEGRRKLSTTRLLDLMRERTRISPYELSRDGNGSNLTIALTVGFEDEQPDTAMRVTNELMTLILAEDARNRSNRAQETTNFLAREVKRLDAEIGRADAQIAEYRKTHANDTSSNKTSMQVALLMAELQEKSAVFSASHPEIVRLKRQLSSLEKIAEKDASQAAGLEILQGQRTSLQRQYDAAAEKMSAARLGESLEQAQFSERLEVLEQAIVPQQPLRPNRPKLLALVLAVAAAAGAGAVLLVESLDQTLRRPRDLLAVVPASLLVSIPYIPSHQEVARKRRGLIVGVLGCAAVGTAALVAVHFYVKPLDDLLGALLGRLFG